MVLGLGSIVLKAFVLLFKRVLGAVSKLERILGLSGFVCSLCSLHSFMSALWVKIEVLGVKQNFE